MGFQDLFGLFKKSKPYKLGIALGGGGARGFAHFGVWQGLKERGVHPEIIAGTSAGSVAGAFISSGKDPKESVELLKSRTVFGYSRIPWSSRGLLSLKGLQVVLEEEMVNDLIEEGNPKLFVTVTNLNEGKVEYVEEGDLPEHVIASSSIPFIFKPVNINNQKYADGGIIDNLPIKPLKEVCDKVIAVSINPIEKSHELGGIIDIAARTFELSINAQNHDIRHQVELYIEPTGTADFGIFDIKSADKMYDIGYECAMMISDKELKPFQD